jgi:hypothetical protein
MGYLHNQPVAHKVIEQIGRTPDRHGERLGQRRRGELGCPHQHINRDCRPRIAPPARDSAPGRQPFAFQIDQQLVLIEGLARQRLQKSAQPGILFDGCFGGK